MADCLFCKIASKEIDSTIVRESDGWLAFRDINPAAPTHVLITPKRHVESAAELTRADSDMLGELFEAMAEIATAEGLTEGFRIVTNVGTHGTQSVKHLHFHLIGGRQMSWPPG